MSPCHAALERAPVRVLVVDDSAVVRGLVIRELEARGGVAVVGRASDGASALSVIDQCRPDVILLDLEMPGMDGMTALPLIVARHPGVRIIIASTLSQRNARISLDALQRGAHDYAPKPSSLIGAGDFHEELHRKVLALGRRAPAQTDGPVVAVAPRTRRPSIAPLQALAIAGSTGAPPVLMRLFEALRGVALPIFLTQHMPVGFTALLAEQLARAGGRSCAEGRDGEPVRPGHAYVAPADWHLTVGLDGAAPVVRLNQQPPEHFCRPAADPMLRSLAAVYGPGLMAVVLTGMGSDGAEGCRAAAAAGGRVLAQDEASSVVWGMPGAVARAGVAEALLPPDQIAARIRAAIEARAA